MNINKLIESLQGCPCGRDHHVNIKAVEIGHGMLARTAEILKNNGFPTHILLVADKNALRAADGIIDILQAGGFQLKTILFDDLRTAEEPDAKKVASESQDCDGILSVGAGSCNDICRRGALLADKEFALFATAPSMDGFASGTSPITENGFKTTRPARQPSIIIGDTSILAAAPGELKAAGFGDLLAKYVALTDWRVSHITTGEYYCPAIAQKTREILAEVTAKCDSIQNQDEQSAGQLMEALVLSGLMMKLADSVRPASGTEHIISHYWEIKEMEQGVLPDYHGKKVGIATLYASRIYHDMIRHTHPIFSEDQTDWDDVYAVYGSHFRSEIEKLNTPTVTSETSPEILAEHWTEICDVVRAELPTPERIKEWLTRAGASVSYKDLSVHKELALEGLKYHPYMRHRMTLMRLLPMTDIKIKPEI